MNDLDEYEIYSYDLYVPPIYAGFHPGIQDFWDSSRCNHP